MLWYRLARWQPGDVLAVQAVDDRDWATTRLQVSTGHEVLEYPPDGGFIMTTSDGTLSDTKWVSRTTRLRSSCRDGDRR